MNKLIIILFSLFSCSHPPIERPFLFHSSSVLSVQNDTIKLLTNFKEWDVELSGFIQPIRVASYYNFNVLQIIPNYSSSIPSQQLHLVLSYKNIHHVYDIDFINTDQKLLLQSYRSPKSLNSDSSLLQYSLSYSMSDLRNIIRTDTTVPFFSEQEIILLAEAGSYNQDQTKPIKTFYVQPGSPASLSLYSTIDSISHCVSITTNYLQDLYGNTISDGTLIYFQVSNGSFKRIYERNVKDGYAYISLPFTIFDSLFISATIGLISSNIIVLKK